MKKALKNLIILGAFAALITTGVASAQTTVLPGATDATINASVNPNGTATSAWFEWGTDVNMYYVTETPHIYMGSGYGEVPLSQKITGLNPNTVYFYRGVANNGTVVKGDIMSFTTTAAVAQTTPVYTNTSSAYTNSYVNTASSYNAFNANDGVNITNVTSTGAILNAVLTNPNRKTSQGYFEWGPTTSFGNNTQMVDLGSAYTSNFSGTLTGLNPNTTYYFRAVAVVGGKTIKGSTKNFQTYAPINNTPVYQSPTVTTNGGQVLNTPVMQNNLSDNTLTANSVIGSSFLPNNIFGWLLLLLIILAIVWAIRKLSQPTTYVVQR